MFELVKLMFEPMNFVDNLYYMGFGMLGIFIVMGIIIAVTYLLNAVFSGKKKEKKASKKDAAQQDEQK